MGPAAKSEAVSRKVSRKGRKITLAHASVSALVKLMAWRHGPLGMTWDANGDWGSMLVSLRG
jgi:hypothetical protein